MKLIHLYSMVLFITVLAFTACKKMDSTYNKFIVPGGLTYLGKVTSPMAYAGHNRVKISWLRGSDRNVTKVKIYWDNYADSIDVNIPPTGDTISVIINNLLEKDYSFMIKTYNANGISSLPVELFCRSLGEKYQAQLINRSVNLTMVDSKGMTTIQWGNADISNGAFATEVKYTNTLGNTIYQNFPISESSSTISDIKPSTRYQYRTMFKPDSLSIDNFFTNYSVSGDLNFDKTDWKIIDYSTQHPGPDNAVTNFIDGNPATRWHTLYGGSWYPHFATIDMGAERTITKFGVWITTYQVPTGDLRGPDKIQFLVSADNLSWTDLGIFDFNLSLLGEQQFNISSNPKARYFKFVAVAGSIDYMVLGEISAYGF